MESTYWSKLLFVDDLGSALDRDLPLTFNSKFQQHTQKSIFLAYSNILHYFEGECIEEICIQHRIPYTFILWYQQRITIISSGLNLCTNRYFMLAFVMWESSSSDYLSLYMSGVPHANHISIAHSIYTNCLQWMIIR
jgi:hypothetical protein